MRDGLLLFTVAVFVLAGFVKGVIGLGLPTITMGLLALVMQPVQAAALVVMPSLLTNVWQMWRGSSLAVVTARLWPMMLAVCAGTWVGSGLMTGSHASAMTSILGLTLALYALSGLLAIRLRVPIRLERWLGPAAGVMTGIITGATGVSVIPAAPYLQAIGLERDELVQALGLSFTVCTLALAANIARAGALNVSILGTISVALAAAIGGMWLGQYLRSRLDPQAFRRCFFIGLLALGLYLMIGAFL
jgi:uncharacterized protein